MEDFIVSYLIILSLIGGYCCWWLYKSINRIADTLHTLTTSKHGRLLSDIGVIKIAVTTSKEELAASIRGSERTIRERITSENEAVRQMIMKQFASQTNQLMTEIEANHCSLTNLMNIVLNLQGQINRGFKDNSSKVGELKNSLTYTISDSISGIDTMLRASIQKLSAEEDKRGTKISVGIDTVIRNLLNFNNLTELHLKILEEAEDKNARHLDMAITSLSSSLKTHTEKITSSCNQVINSEKEFYQKTKGCFDLTNENLSKYLAQLKQFDTLYNNLQKLYTRILEQDNKISQQESSLVSMVSRHAQIFELTSEMNKTTKEIFEFMKLYLIDSTVSKFK